MKAPVILFAIFALVCINPCLAQEKDFCESVATVMKSGKNGYKDLPAQYSFDVFTNGDAAEEGVWRALAVMKNKKEAERKYLHLEAKLNGCFESMYPSPAAVPDNKQQMSTFGEWKPRNGQGPTGADVYMELRVADGEYMIELRVTVKPGAEETKTVATESSVESSSADFCRTLNKVLRADRDFTGIRGDELTEEGDMYRSFRTEQLSGSSISKVTYRLGGPVWTADFTESGNEDEVIRKYNELKEIISACKKEIGSMVVREMDSYMGKTTVWLPFMLSEDYRQSHANIRIELVRHQTVRMVDGKLEKPYQVYLKISRK